MTDPQQIPLLMPPDSELVALEDALTGGVTEDFVTEAGGVLGFALQCAAGGCSCEPCQLCEDGVPHEVGHECLDYKCLGCEAEDYLAAVAPRPRVE